MHSIEDGSMLSNKPETSNVSPGRTDSGSTRTGRLLDSDRHMILTGRSGCGIFLSTQRVLAPCSFELAAQRSAEYLKANLDRRDSLQVKLMVLQGWPSDMLQPTLTSTPQLSSSADEISSLCTSPNTMKISWIERLMLLTLSLRLLLPVSSVGSIGWYSNVGVKIKM
jgi:hypothetical protein